MKLRALRSFWWAGNHVEKGSLLIEADEATALYIIRLGNAEAAEDVVVPAVSAMVVEHADPVVQVRDPIAAPKGRRRS